MKTCIFSFCIAFLFFSMPSLSGQLACFPPMDVTTSLSNNMMTISWADADGAIGYQVSGGLVGANQQADFFVSGNSFTFSVGSLPACTELWVQVQTLCFWGLSNTSPTLIFNAGSCSNCPVPTNLATNVISSTEAAISWDPVPAAISYTIEAYIPWALFPVQFTITGTSFSSNVLFPGLSYWWKVRANCSSSSSSVWSPTQYFNTPGFAPHSNENARIPTVGVYPNPVVSALYLKGEFPPDYNHQYAIYDSKGAMIKSGTLQEDNKEVEVAHFPSGIYSIQIENGMYKPMVKRFIKQ